MPNTRATLWTKDFILLLLSNMFIFFGFQMLTPTLPVYVAEYGGNKTMISAVISIFTITAVIIRPFSALFFDKLGKKTVLLIGVLLFFASSGGFYWAINVYLILAIRLVHGLGFGVSSTAFGTIASDMVPASRRGEGIGYFSLGTTLSMALGPFVGIWLMNRYGFDYVFSFSALSCLLSFFLSLFVSLPADQQTVKEKPSPSFWLNLIEKEALFPSFLVLLLGLTYGGIVTFITLFAQEVGIENVGWFFLTYALFSFVTRPVAGILFDKKGPSWVLLPGAFFTLLGLICLSQMTSLSILIVAATLYGIGFGAIQPSINAWIINRVQQHRTGAANATFHSSFDLGIASGALLLGSLATIFSYATMYLYSTLAMLIYLIVYLTYLHQSRKMTNSSSINLNQ